MKTLLVLVVMFCSSVCLANEWIPYQGRVQPQILPPQYVQYPQYPIVPVPVVIPLCVYYAPVVSYQSVLVEHKQWCLFKRYEIVNLPKIEYVPVRY